MREHTGREIRQQNPKKKKKKVLPGYSILDVRQ